jgi:hypothetical protein
MPVALLSMIARRTKPRAATMGGMFIVIVDVK